MTFCTIEEAWGTSSQENFTNIETYQNIDFSKSSNNQERVVEAESEPEPIIKNNISENENENLNNSLLSDKVDYVIENQLKEIQNDKQRLETKLDSNVNKINSNLRSEIDLINKKIDNILKRLEKQNTNVDFFNKNIHDIILFVIFGLFIILVLDGMYKLLMFKLSKIVN